MTDLTKEDLKNGWTEESLARYQRERQAAAMQRIDPHSDQRRAKPQKQNSKYSVLRWRR